MANDQNLNQNTAVPPQGSISANPTSSQSPVFSASLENPNVVTISGPPVKPLRKFVPGKNIIKIILGLIFVLIVISVVSFLVLPLFKENLSSKGAISYWGLWEDGKTMQVIISDYESQNPGIKIDYSKQDIKQYRESITTRIENGSGPDIFTFHNTWYPMISKVLLPFPNDVISKEEFSKIFYPVAQKDLIKNIAIYSIPPKI